MVLILGGAYQGKLTYAAKRYFLTKDDIFDLSDGAPDRPYPCFTHLEALTRRQPNPEKYLPLFRDSILISREIGSGIVPMDPEERAWRECHGSLVQKIAVQSDRVVRIFCGLEEVLK